MISRLSAASRKQFEQAVALMQEGRFSTAEIVCAELLARAPDDPELAHFGGVLANRMGRYDVAIERLKRCVGLDPRRARSYAALGFAQDAAGYLDDAHESFAAAVRADPRFAEAHNSLGIVANRLGRHEEAIQSFDRALALNPRFAQACLNAASALQHVGRSEAAAHRYREALRLAGDNPQIVRQCALGLQGTGDLQDAIVAMQGYLKRNRDDAVRGQLALALGQVGRTAEAEREVAQALEGAPTDPKLHSVRAALRQGSGDWEGAVAAFRRAVELDPGQCEARINLAMALRSLGRATESDLELAEARRYAAGDFMSLSLLATIHGEAGDAETAISLFEAAIAVNPVYPKAHAWLGTELLRAGRIARGWDEYVYRPSRGTEIYASIAAGRYPPRLPPVVRGSSYALLCEQGLGDVLFFLRYARPLAEAGAKLHVVRGDRRLEALVRRAMPIESWTEGDQIPAGAVALWIGDLPVVARPLAGDVAPTLRIAPLAERVERMRARLPAGKRPLVAVAWRAGTPKGEERSRELVLRKNIPVEVVARALAARGSTCIVLQRHPDPDELRRFGDLAEAHDFSKVNDDLEDMLALLSLIDDYVGVSSTNVHLLAAVGGRGHILVPQPTEWRWQLEGSSPWFPGFGVHRQGRDREWSAALQFPQGEAP